MATSFSRAGNFVDFGTQTHTESVTATIACLTVNRELFMIYYMVQISPVFCAVGCRLMAVLFISRCIYFCPSYEHKMKFYSRS